MNKKLLTALMLSLAMAGTQVNAAPSALENAWNNPTDPNHKMYQLPNNGTVTIQEGLNFRDDNMFEINDFDHDPTEHYGSINGNGHSGFSMGGVAGIGVVNAKDIYGFNTDGNGGAFNMTDDSFLQMDTWMHDGTTPLMTTIRNNTATGQGGGIYQKGSYGTGVYLMNVSVKNNHAGAEGGGMYINYSVSTIDALEGSTVEFRDNTAVINGEEVANDIYLYTKPQEWVRGSLKVHTDSNVEGSSTTEPSGKGVIYIGDMRAASYYDVKVSSSKSDTDNGLVTIGRLWLDGTSSFDTSKVAKQSQTEINIGLLDMKGNSVLNTVNNYIDNNLNIGNIQLDNSQNSFLVDADLANNKIDHFGSVSASGGTAKLNLNIISANTAGGSLKLFDAEDTNITITGGKTQYGDNSYAYSQAADKRYINYTVERATTLQEALQDITVDSYDMPDVYTANSNLGQLYHFDPEPPYDFVPRTFTVNGNGGILITDGIAEREGISIPEQLNPPEEDSLTPHLIVKDLNAYSGFTRRATDISAATGGAIWAEDSTLEVDNVTFTDNMATGSATASINTFGMGGAIYVATRDGNYPGGDNFVSKINNSSFLNNKTVTYGTMGSAVLVDGGGAVFSKGNLDVTDSLFANNSAISNMNEGIAEGGALYVSHNSDGGGVNRDVNISGTMFMGNVAGDVIDNGELKNTQGFGGAIFASRVDMNIDDSSFINNTAHAATYNNGYTDVKGEAQGGAIHIEKVVQSAPYGYNINNSTFAMNTAEVVKSIDNGDGTYTLAADSVDQSMAYGGAIAIMRPIETTPKIDVNINGSDFYVNKSGWGGAIYNKGALVNIKDSTFRSNVANFYYIDSDDPRWNEDMTGGAIYNSHTLNIDGSEFSGNYAKQIADDNVTVNTVKNDIRNDRELHFVGNASTLDGGINGSGYTYFELDEGQTMNIGENTSISQALIEVVSGTVNIANADNITAKIELNVGENGTLNIESGKVDFNNKYTREVENSGNLNNKGTLDVTGEGLYTSKVTNNSGATLVNAGYISAATILNDGTFLNGVDPDDPSQLIATATLTGDIINNTDMYNAGVIDGAVNNAGLFINDGETNGDITNDGGIVTNEGEINGNIGNDNGTVMNSGTMNGGGISNSNGGNVVNDGIINGNNSNYDDSSFTNNGVINGYADNYDDATFVNNGSIDTTSQPALHYVTNEGTYTNNGDIIGGIDNSGTFQNTGSIDTTGTDTDSITNTGIFANTGDVIAATILNNGTMMNGVDPEDPSQIIATATLTGDVTNNSDMYNAGIMNGDITNNADSVFENDGEINGDLTNYDDSEIINNGTINGYNDNYNDATFTNNGIINGWGDNYDDATFVNNGTVDTTYASSSQYVSNEGTYINNGNIIGGIENEGTFQNSGSIDATGTDTDSVYNDGMFANTGSVTASAITNDSMLVNGVDITDPTAAPVSSATITGDITNNSIAINSGTIAGNVTGSTTGSSTLAMLNGGTVQGNVTNGNLMVAGGDATITGDVTNMDTIMLTSNPLDDSPAGTLSLGGDVSTNNFVATGGTLNLQNGTTSTADLGNIVLADSVNLLLDADYTNMTSDSIKGTFDTTASNPDAKINIAGINVTDGSESMDGRTIDIFNGDETARAALKDYITVATGSVTEYDPIFVYSGGYDSSTGTMNVSKDYNPAVLTSDVAVQTGGFLTQLSSYTQAFTNMDNFMLMPSAQRQAMKMRNKYAAGSEVLAYDATQYPVEQASGWVNPYVTFENVKLKNGPKVNNTLYGSYFGLDSGIKELSHGWDGIWGVYAGYNGAHQHYNGISVYQNGGTLGLNGTLYKNNFFTGLTANVGASAGQAHTMYGTDDFAMLMTGVASKTGYNWELADGKFTIQPSYMMSYSFVDTFDYTNAAGVRITSDPLHAIQIEPGLKFIGNLKNGWQPYAGVSVVWNLMDKAHIKANDVALPEMSVKPFVKYGVGVRKTWGERFTGFFQAFVTNGGRNGIGLQGGFRWAIGKDPSSGSTKKTSSMPQKKETKISLNNIK